MRRIKAPVNKSFMVGGRSRKTEQSLNEVTL
jgi:hypothetical protein